MTISIQLTCIAENFEMQLEAFCSSEINEKLSKESLFRVIRIYKCAEVYIAAILHYQGSMFLSFLAFSALMYTNQNNVSTLKQRFDWLRTNFAH